MISKFKLLLRFLKRKLTKWSFKTFSINYICKLISWIVIATHISRISKSTSEYMEHGPNLFIYELIPSFPLVKIVGVRRSIDKIDFKQSE